MSEQTFVSAVLAGDALASDIDDWVDSWHESSTASASLQDFLGMSWDEYRLWSEQPAALRFILAARNSGSAVGSVQIVASLAAAAARATNESEAAGVVQWLKHTGRISEI